MEAHLFEVLLLNIYKYARCGVRPIERLVHVVRATSFRAAENLRSFAVRSARSP